MHTCPDCQMACDCEGEDTWMELSDPSLCMHDCEDDEGDDWYPYEGEELCG